MKKLFKWVFVIIIFLQAAVLVAGVVIFRMPLPDHEIDVSGLPLTDFVEIIRDERIRIKELIDTYSKYQKNCFYYL